MMEQNGFDALKLENQMCFPLYAAAREVTKLYRPYLDVLNLTYTQYITMMVLWECGECSVKALGDAHARAQEYGEQGLCAPRPFA